MPDGLAPEMSTRVFVGAPVAHTVPPVLAVYQNPWSRVGDPRGSVSVDLILPTLVTVPCALATAYAMFHSLLRSCSGICTSISLLKFLF